MARKEYKPERPVSAPLPGVGTSKASECPTCKEVFTTPSNFDKHLRRVSCRIDKYRMVCQDPVDVGLEIGKRGFWAMPGREEEE